MSRFSMLTMITTLVLGCSGGTQQAPPPESGPEPVARAEPAEEPPASEPEPAAAAEAEHLSLDESVDFCVRLHEQMVSCAAEFIDLNIELRSRYFPEFAEAVGTPEKLAEMRRVGIEEVRADGTGPMEPRRERCTGYVKQGPPAPRSTVPIAEDCYAKVACAEKVECMRPILEQRYQARARGAKLVE